MFWRTAVFLGFSLVNPLCMVASFAVCLEMDVYGRVGANEAQFDARFFPVYLTVGIVVQLLQILLAYGIARWKHREGRTTLAEAADAFLFAERPFVIFVLLLFILLDRIEGNVVAFAGIYAFPFVILTAGLVTIRFFKRLKTLVGEPSRRAVTLLPGLVGVSTLAIVVSLTVVWVYGPVNRFGDYLAWRSDTPQYAICKIATAVQEDCVEDIEDYVDLDAVLSQFAVVGGPTKAQWTDALIKGRVARESDGEIAYNEWKVQSFGDCCGRLARLCEKDGRFTAEVFVESQMTGQTPSLVFAMEKIHGKYRVTRVTNMADIVQSLDEQQTQAQKVLALRDEAKAKARPLVDFRLHGMRVEDDRLHLQFDVVNKGTVPIARVQCVVLLRRTDTGVVAMVKTMWPSFYPTQLAPGQARTAEDSEYVSSAVARSIEAKQLVVSDVFPASVEFADEHRDELVKLPD